VDERIKQGDAAKRKRHMRRQQQAGEPQPRYYATAEQAIGGDLARALGWTGLPASSKRGDRSQERNPALSPYKARGFRDDPGIYDEMLRTDGTVAGTLAMMTREISRARWAVEMPTQPTRKEAEAAEMVERYLGLDGREPWIYGGLPHHLRHAVKALAYGFAPFEVAWSPRMWTRVQVMVPDQVRWRAPQSVWGWAWDGEGELAGMVQVAPKAHGAMTEAEDLVASLLGQRHTVTIPASRLLLYTYDETEGAPEGVSIYRPAWVWWRAKRDVLLRHMRAVESPPVALRRLVDKEGRVMPDSSDRDLDDFAEVYEGLADGSTAWLQIPPGWDVEQLKLGEVSKSPEALLAYCDSQIRTVFLAQLLGAEAATGGLSGALGQLLYNSIDGVAAWIGEVLCGQPGRPWTGVLRAMIDANIPHDGSLRYPRLVARGLEHQDTKAWVDATTKALQFGAMWYTAGVEDEMRRALDMPPLTPQEREQREAWAQTRFASGDVTTPPAGVAGASADGGERASEEGTQGDAVQSPEQTDVQDPDGA